jgi:hypothetical protein
MNVVDKQHWLPTGRRVCGVVGLEVLDLTMDRPALGCRDLVVLRAPTPADPVLLGADFHLATLELTLKC